MVCCINNGENKLPKPTLTIKEDQDIEDALQFDSSELLLDDKGEDKIYKLDKIKFDLSKDEKDDIDRNQAEDDKYRQYMSWMP